MSDPVREALLYLIEATDANAVQHDVYAARARAALTALDREREERDRLRARVAKLERAIRTVVADGESQHPGGWGPDVTMLRVLQDALSAGENDDE